MAQIKVIFWDIDGTLLNFEVAEESAIRKGFAAFGLGPCSDAMLAEYSTITAPIGAARARRDHKAGRPGRALQGVFLAARLRPGSGCPLQCRLSAQSGRYGLLLPLRLGDRPGPAEPRAAIRRHQRHQDRPGPQAARSGWARCWTVSCLRGERRREAGSGFLPPPRPCCRLCPRPDLMVGDSADQR